MSSLNSIAEVTIPANAELFIQLNEQQYKSPFKVQNNCQTSLLNQFPKIAEFMNTICSGQYILKSVDILSDNSNQYLLKFIGSGNFYDDSQEKESSANRQALLNQSTYLVQKSASNSPIPWFESLTLETLIDIISDPWQNASTEYLQILFIFWLQTLQFQDESLNNCSSTVIYVLQYMSNLLFQCPYHNANDEVCPESIMQYAYSNHIERQKSLLAFIHRWITNVQKISSEMVDQILITYYRFCCMQSITVVFNNQKILHQEQMYEIKFQLEHGQLLDIQLFKNNKLVLVTKDSIHQQFISLIEQTIYKFTLQVNNHRQSILFGLKQKQNVPQYLNNYAQYVYQNHRNDNILTIKGNETKPTKDILFECIRALCDSLKQPHIIINSIIEYIMKSYNNINLYDIVQYLQEKPIDKRNTIQQLNQKIYVLQIVFQLLMIKIGLKKDQIYYNQQTQDLIIEKLLTLMQNKENYDDFLQNNFEYNVEQHQLSIDNQNMWQIQQLFAVCIQHNLFLIMACLQKALFKFNIKIKLSKCMQTVQSVELQQQDCILEQLNTASSLIEQKASSQKIQIVSNNILEQDNQKFQLNKVYRLDQIQYQNKIAVNKTKIDYDRLFIDDSYYLIIQERLQTMSYQYLPNNIPLLNQMINYHNSLFKLQERPYIFQYKTLELLYKTIVIIMMPQQFFESTFYEQENSKLIVDLLESLADFDDISTFDISVPVFKM